VQQDILETFWIEESSEAAEQLWRPNGKRIPTQNWTMPGNWP